MDVFQVFGIANFLKLCVVTLGFRYLYSLYFQLRYWPPGPRGLPILGNIFQLPKFQWYKFTEWKIQYGPIFSLNLAGQPVVVLNTHKVAADLLNRRSHIYSDRPRFIMAGEILTGGMLIAFMPYADPWRRMRKASHEGLSVRASEKFKYIQEKEATRLIFHLLRDPDNWDAHLKRSSASVILSSIYGWKPIEPEDDPLVERINGLMHRLVRAALPGAYLVEIFPVMKWFPSWVAKWKREGLGWYRKDTEMFRGFLADVKKEMNTGNCKPCFSSLLLDNQTKFNLTNDESSWLAGTMFGAGAETTAAALSVFMLAMVSYPDVMRRAQAEIDRVVGCDRPPNFGDHDSLPYIRAMVKEVLRWRPVGPLGLPRRTIESDWYEGYYIPKGALVIYNTWAMNRDPILFPDYDEFRPDRFLDSSGQFDQTPPDTLSMGHVTYGFGKRICLGMNMANQSLFIDIAYILWALNIEQATDGQGNFIVPSKTDCVDEGLVVRPVPFKCKITARSGDAVAILESTRADEIN